MYSLVLAPVHAPNLSAPDFLSAKLISKSSVPPARVGIAFALRSSLPSIIAGSSTTTQRLGFCSGLVVVSLVASIRSLYGNTRRLDGTVPPLLSDASASASVLYV